MLRKTTPVPRTLTIDTLACPTVIVPGDFDFGPSSAGRRGQWTQGTLRHVSEALAGAPVLIVLDTMTGHTVIGVLGQAGSTPSTRYGFEVQTTGSDYYVVQRVEKIGAIMPLPLEGTERTKGPKWVAVDLARVEHRAALELAREKVAAQDRNPMEGAYSMDSTGDGVLVSHAEFGPKRSGHESWLIGLQSVRERAVDLAHADAERIERVKAERLAELANGSTIATREGVVIAEVTHTTL